MGLIYRCHPWVLESLVCLDYQKVQMDQYLLYFLVLLVNLGHLYHQLVPEDQQVPVAQMVPYHLLAPADPVGPVYLVFLLGQLDQLVQKVQKDQYLLLDLVVQLDLVDLGGLDLL